MDELRGGAEGGGAEGGAREARGRSGQSDRSWSRLRRRASEAWRDLRRLAGPRLARLARRAREYWPPPWRHVLVAAGVVVLLLWVGWMRCGIRGCPDVSRLAAYQPGGAPVVLDRHGEELARLTPVSGRTLVSLEDLPEHVTDAFLAVEDQRFYEHNGVDWRRAVGSALSNLRAGGIAEGFSTITMQLARNVFPDRLPGEQRTLRRKVLEIRVARLIEGRFTKDEILELYLNHIYFGGSLYGLDAAAWSYFGKEPPELTLAEGATLAAMPKAPNAYDPRSNPARARERRDLVLALMAEQGRIDPGEAERAREAAVRTRPERPLPETELHPAPYFVRAVRRAVESRMGDAMYARPIRIHTTLDPVAQRAAEESLERQLRAIERGAHGRYRGERRYGAEDAVDEHGTRYIQGAAVVLHAETGDVLALVGGRDYRDSPFDRAMGARRQVGSAFKPFVYAAALREGYAPSQHLVDEPLRMELAGGEVWEPRNFTGGYRGEVTLRDAAVQSNNVATVRLAMAVGLDEVEDAARDAGVRSDMPELPSLALGATEMSLLELTTAYVPLTAGGQAVRPRLITRVEDPDGDELWSTEPDRRRALDEDVAYLVTDLLRDAVDRGTGRAVRTVGLQGPAAGKTGTTNDGNDVWFIGYTPELVGGVWMGFDRPRPVADLAAAGELAAPVWGRMMAAIQRTRGTPVEWERPESVVERQIDPATGLVLEEGCRPERGEPRTELFLRSAVPASVCPAGEPEAQGLLQRIGSGLRSFFGRIGEFIGGLFGGGEDEEEEIERRQREEYLGRPRLPREAEAPRDTTPRSAPPLGVPVDSLPPGFGEVPVETETVPAAPEPPDPDPDADLEPEPEDTVPGDTARPLPLPPAPVDTGSSTTRPAGR